MDPIAEVPDIPPVEIPKAICHKPKQYCFGKSVTIEEFTADNQCWCVMASATIKSIECAELVSNLLNSDCIHIFKKSGCEIAGFCYSQSSKGTN